MARTITIDPVTRIEGHARITLLPALNVFVHDAYRGGRGADEQMLLELFDGGAYTSIRVRGDRAYGGSHVAILGNIQPAVLKGLVAGTDPSGKWARFLFCSLPERIAPLPLEVPETAGAPWADRAPGGAA